MTENNSTRFEKQLDQITENQWFGILEGLLPDIHEVDRAATQIWFSFYPLTLFRHLQKTDDLEATLHGFAMQGDNELKTQIDTSHMFLWGHRFWADVKHAIAERANSFESDSMNLAEEIKLLAKSISKGVGQDESLLIGITAVGLMTLVQTGLEAFKAAKGETKSSGLLSKSPAKILEVRSKEKSQGILGFLKTVNKDYQVIWDETESKAKFDIIHDEEIASGAARDQSQNWLEKDERCGEGVIPVECRAAACGTCWVGVVSGANKLSDVDRMERKQMKIFGYKQGDEAKPIMRLACQAQAEGSVSIVIPPWNGVFGKKLYGVEKIELKPATTSAQKLRDTIEDAMTIKE